MANLGVNVIEVDGRAAPNIVAAPISTAGFLIRTERGIPDLAVPVCDSADFTTKFGGYTASAFGPFVVRGFFDNQGSDAYVVRVVDRANAAAATVMLLDRRAAPINTLLVQAGIRGRPDPGDWGNSLSVRIADHPRATSLIPAQILGAAAAIEPFALAAGQTLVFTVTVRGTNTVATVTFQTTDFANIAAASASEVAAAIN